mgnify:CR=1 FL=1
MVKNLKKLRNQFGISQQQLADVIAVSQQSVNKYENHSVEPDIDTLIRMADYFHVTVDYLIGRSETERCEMPGITSGEVDLLNKIRKLKPVQKECILKIIESYEY